MSNRRDEYGSISEPLYSLPNGAHVSRINQFALNLPHQQLNQLVTTSGSFFQMSLRRQASLLRVKPCTLPNLPTSAPMPSCNSGHNRNLASQKKEAARLLRLSDGAVDAWNPNVDALFQRTLLELKPANPSAQQAPHPAAKQPSNAARSSAAAAAAVAPVAGAAQARCNVGSVLAAYQATLNLPDPVHPSRCSSRSCSPSPGLFHRAASDGVAITSPPAPPPPTNSASTILVLKQFRLPEGLRPRASPASRSQLPSWEMSSAWVPYPQPSGRGTTPSTSGQGGGIATIANGGRAAPASSSNTRSTPVSYLRVDTRTSASPFSTASAVQVCSWHASAPLHVPPGGTQGGTGGGDAMGLTREARGFMSEPSSGLPSPTIQSRRLNDSLSPRNCAAAATSPRLDRCASPSGTGPAGRCCCAGCLADDSGGSCLEVADDFSNPYSRRDGGFRADGRAVAGLPPMRCSDFSPRGASLSISPPLRCPDLGRGVAQQRSMPVFNSNKDSRLTDTVRQALAALEDAPLEGWLLDVNDDRLDLPLV